MQYVLTYTVQQSNAEVNYSYITF